MVLEGSVKLVRDGGTEFMAAWKQNIACLHLWVSRVTSQEATQKVILRQLVSFREIPPPKDSSTFQNSAAILTHVSRWWMFHF